MFSSVLIANRGEIACRIAQTARRLGLRVIAVYSDADADALHVKLADKAVHIGPAAAAQSYLDAEKILKVARDEGARCIHPGYGFLSENADFADQCEQAGIVFVGPPSAAIRAMGAKDAAKDLMEKNGVPVVPGYHGTNQDARFLKAKALETGYPVMIKAVMGGGGKGMRIVERHADFASALEACRREAQSAFGDSCVLIEKFISKPRHIEIQIFADEHGNIVHLFERDCSLQRRHQKVIEEAPAPGMTKQVRDAMTKAAIDAARAVGYRGAGTVEFIADASAGLRPDGFYFMEMNTRLQVEHPVSEMITGIDLVEWQLRIAAGEKLPLEQSGITLNGHAIEARIYAEDPQRGFLPQTGRLHRLSWPSDNRHLRIDTGVEQGDEISPHYDPMIAKLIVHGNGRSKALAHLKDALAGTTILGLASNIAFLSRLVRDETFVCGKMNTALIGEHAGQLNAASDAREYLLIAAASWICLKTKKSASRKDPWQALRGWSPAGTERVDVVHLVLNGTAHVFEARWRPHGFEISLKDEAAFVRISEDEISQEVFCAKVDGRQVEAPLVFDPQHEQLFIAIKGTHFEICPVDLLACAHDEANAGGIIRAPMPGRIICLNVAKGEKVETGATLLVLEAMKMEHALKAGFSGTVREIKTAEGAQADEGDVLVILEAGDS